MQDFPVPASRRARVAEDVLCAASYITMLPAIAILVRPRTARNPRLRFHACQSILLNWLLFVVGFFLHIRAGIDQLLDAGSGARFEWAARLLCIAVWAAVSLSMARGRELRIPFISSLAEKQANGWSFRRLTGIPAEATFSAGPRLKQAMLLSS